MAEKWEKKYQPNFFQVFLVAVSFRLSLSELFFFFDFGEYQICANSRHGLRNHESRENISWYLRSRGAGCRIEFAHHGPNIISNSRIRIEIFCGWKIWFKGSHRVTRCHRRWDSTTKMTLRTCCSMSKMPTTRRCIFGRHNHGRIGRATGYSLSESIFRRIV